MLLGALVDIGVPLDDISAVIDRLGVDGVTLTAEKSQRGGVPGTHVTVNLEESQASRTIADFVRITRNSGLSEAIVEPACRIFERLGEAEAQVHGTVHGESTPLHELGTLDTLVDVVGTVAGLNMLKIKNLTCSPLPSGSGIFRSAHGKLLAPSPATAALIALANAPMGPPPGGDQAAGEMVTPTGAAIVTTLATFRQPTMTLDGVGYGLGSRNPEVYPNIVSLRTGEELEPPVSGGLTLLETNIDDMSPELIGFVQERLFSLGARDVWLTPIQMKKGRPGTLLSVLVTGDLEQEAVALVMRETTTLGVRVRPITRYEAEREIVTVETTLGSARVKVKRLDGRAVSASPEYEDCRQIALESGIPLQDVYRAVQAEAASKLLDR
jgi:pyridinium-3,5-bisthiocarboxylic acid mononucleotide nickel chelatase